MTKKTKEEIFNIIEKQISDLKSSIDLLKEKIKPVSPDVSLGRLTRQEARQEQELNKNLLQESEIRLKKLKYAKDRVFKESYGYCDICDEEININRLKLVPESVICMECLSEK